MKGSKYTPFYTLTRREVERFLAVWVQTFMAPVISAALYILVFGQFIGSRIGEVGGVSYSTFLIPGLVMMNVITTSYGGSAFSVFFSKWEKTIHDILTSPISYLQMVVAILLGSGILRALLIGSAVWAVLALFGGATLVHPWVVLYFAIATGLVFSSLGMMVGLWAERFDHFNVIQTFVITPLIYLGGVFYSIETLPETMQSISLYNPMIYMVNGMRYGMTGFADIDVTFSAVVVAVLAVVMLGVCVALFRSGYKLRS